MTKATAIVGVTCFLVLSATVYVALSDKDHSTTDIGSPSATTDLHVDKVKDAEAGEILEWEERCERTLRRAFVKSVLPLLVSADGQVDSFWKHTTGSGQCNKPQLSKIDRSIKAAAPKIQYAIDNKYDTARACNQPSHVESLRNSSAGTTRSGPSGSGNQHQRTRITRSMTV